MQSALYQIVQCQRARLASYKNFQCVFCIYIVSTWAVSWRTAGHVTKFHPKLNKNREHYNDIWCWTELSTPAFVSKQPDGSLLKMKSSCNKKPSIIVLVATFSAKGDQLCSQPGVVRPGREESLQRVRLFLLIRSGEPVLSDRGPVYLIHFGGRRCFIVHTLITKECFSSTAFPETAK